MLSIYIVWFCANELCSLHDTLWNNSQSSDPKENFIFAGIMVCVAVQHTEFVQNMLYVVDVMLKIVVVLLDFLKLGLAFYVFHSFQHSTLLLFIEWTKLIRKLVCRSYVLNR